MRPPPVASALPALKLTRSRGRNRRRLFLTLCQARARGSDGLFEVLRRAERDFPARLDLDRLAGRGVAAHARGPVAHREDAEPPDSDPRPLLEILHKEPDKIAEHRLCLLLCDLVALGEGSRDMLAGHRRWGARLLRRHSCIPLVGRRRLSATRRESQEASQRKKSPYYAGIPCDRFRGMGTVAPVHLEPPMPLGVKVRVTLAL